MPEGIFLIFYRKSYECNTCSNHRRTLSLICTQFRNLRPVKLLLVNSLLPKMDPWNILRRPSLCFCFRLHTDHLLSSHTGCKSPSLLIVASLPLCVQPAYSTICRREASLTRKWQSPASSRPSTMPFSPVKTSKHGALSRWTTQNTKHHRVERAHRQVTHL